MQRNSQYAVCESDDTMWQHRGFQHSHHDYRRVTGRLCLYSGVLLLFAAIGCAESSEKHTDDAAASMQSATPSQKVENAGTRIRLTEITPDCGLNFVARTGQEDGRFTILEEARLMAVAFLRAGRMGSFASMQLCGLMM